MKIEPGILHDLKILMYLLYLPGLSLKCYTCYSRTSWADCRQQSTVRECGSLFGICMSVHRVGKRRDGTIVHEFAKTCFDPKQCTRRNCEQAVGYSYVSVKCAVQCCSTGCVCNEG